MHSFWWRLKPREREVQDARLVADCSRGYIALQQGNGMTVLFEGKSAEVQNKVHRLRTMLITGPPEASINVTSPQHILARFSPADKHGHVYVKIGRRRAVRAKLTVYHGA